VSRPPSCPSGPPRTRLIVNADDLGQDAHRDRSILALFSAGALSSASLVVNGPAAANAAAAANTAGLPLGLHLNLGDGRALTGVSSLTDREGSLPGKHGLRTALCEGRISEADIGLEIAAQIDCFRTLCGRLPDHVDGHHHCHVAPLVASGLIAEMQRAGLDRIRLPKISDDVEPTADVTQRFATSPRCRRFYQRVQAEAAQAEPLFRRAGLRFPDRFCGIALMGSGMTPDRLRTALRRIAASQVASAELMCHPGHPDPTGDDFANSPERRQESATLHCLLARVDGENWPFDLIPATFKELNDPCAR